MAIEPDTKDWTWVLQRPCPECGFEAAGVAAGDVAGLVRANAAGWANVLRRDDVAVRADPDVWSPLEYACHVRDVFTLFDMRLHLMLNQDGPHFANWDQDETAVTERYGEQDPATVAAELGEAAEQVANSFAAIGDHQLARTGFRSDGAAFTVQSFGQYFVHDPIHHLWDVGEQSS